MEKILFFVCIEHRYNHKHNHNQISSSSRFKVMKGGGASEKAIYKKAGAGTDNAKD